MTVSRLTTFCVCVLAFFATGCGTTISRSATEQLLTSDAVDRSVAMIDFSPMAGKKVFFETRYIRSVKGIGFVNADYIISSLRQQMVAARCLLQESQSDAEFVVEARVGALGSDNHEINYGIPPTGSLVTTASSLMTTMPAIPAIPELSVAKKNNQKAAAKIRVFAYDNETKEPVWQSGLAKSLSTAKDTWFFGAGPFQNGTIYEEARFAGNRFWFPFLKRKKRVETPGVGYDQVHVFPQLTESSEEKATNDKKVAKDAATPKDEGQETQPVSATKTQDSPTPQKNETPTDQRTPKAADAVQKPVEASVKKTDDKRGDLEPGRVRIGTWKNIHEPLAFPEEMKLYSPDSQVLRKSRANETVNEFSDRVFSDQEWQNSESPFKPIE